MARAPVNAMRPCSAAKRPLGAPTDTATVKGCRMTKPKYDVVAIGNAIVDVMAPCGDALIDELGMTRGGIYTKPIGVAQAGCQRGLAIRERLVTKT